MPKRGRYGAISAESPHISAILHGTVAAWGGLRRAGRVRWQARGGMRGGTQARPVAARVRRDIASTITASTSTTPVTM